MNSIVNDLVDDHKRFRQFLTHYERELDVLRSGGDPNYELLNDLAEYFSLFPDEIHHKKEDVIYDFLMESNDGRMASPSQGNARLRDLQSDHAAISNDAAIFREGVAQILNGGQLPRDELSHYGSSYILTLRRHMQHEEDSFFPRAVAVIKDDAWKELTVRLGDLLTEEVNIYKAREVLKIETALLARFS